MTGAVGGRTDAAVLAAIALVVLGTVLGNAALFVAAAVPISILLLSWLASPPSPEIAVERRIDPSPAAPGERTSVTLTVHNEGETTLSDARFVDGVPTELSVSAGSPRGCLSIRPGESGSISYEIVPRQGRYEFEDPIVRLRPISGAAVTTTHSPAVGDATLSCRRNAGAIPQLNGALRRVGTQPTDSGGPGIQFHSTREYRPGDEVRRIDWRRLAKTGELTTVNFDETSTAETVVIADGRSAGRRARTTGHPTATELTAYAADRAITALVSAGNAVGLCALGITNEAVDVPLASDDQGRPWVPTGLDDATRTQIDAVLDAVAEGARAEPDDSRLATPSDAVADGGHGGAFFGLRTRLSNRADVIVVTPALDEAPVSLVETVLAAGHRTVVIAPDVTDCETPGRAVRHAERVVRLRRLRATDATVIDWDTRQPLSATLEAHR